MAETLNAIIAQLNQLGEIFWQFVLAMFIQSSVLIVVVFAIDFLIRRRVRAVVRYCIWMLVLVKLVLPTTLSLPTGIGSWFVDMRPAQPVISEYAAIKATTTINPPSAPADPITPIKSGERQARTLNAWAGTSSKSSSTAAAKAPAVHTATMATHSIAQITWQAALLLVWLCGLAVLGGVLLGHAYRVRRLIGKAELANPKMRAVLDACRTRVGLRHVPVELRIASDLVSPAVCGLFRPTIIIPGYLTDRLESKQLRAVLVHELAHVKRGDLIVSLIQTLLQIVYFYNPLVWLANRCIRRVREQAVDETTLVALDTAASAYSDTLLDLATAAKLRPVLSLRLIGLVESKKALSQRIRYILGRPVPRTAKLGVAGLVVVIALAVVLLPMARAEIELDQNKTFTAPQTDFVARGVLSGRITDEQGNPVTDAKIELMGNRMRTLRAKTDANGYYHFNKIEKDGDYHIAINSQRWVSIIRNTRIMPLVQLRKGQSTVKHITLKRACRIKVRTVDEKGEPVKKVRLLANCLAEKDYLAGESFSTGDDGWVTIGGLAPAEADYLIATMDKRYGFSRLTVKLTDPDKVESTTMVLSKGQTVTGRAICSDGQPAAGWRIEAEPVWWHFGTSLGGQKIKEDGSFEIPHVIPGKYNIVISIPQGGGSSSAFNAMTSVELPLREGNFNVKIDHPSPKSMASITGTITYLGGNITRGFHLWANSEDRQHHSDAYIEPGENQFKIRSLPKGVYTLRFQSPEFKEVVIKGVRAPSKNLKVKIEVTGRPILQGVVISADTGKPVTQFKARVKKWRTISGPHYVQDNRWHEIKSDQGKFAIDVTGPGVYEVLIAADGFAWTPSEKINTETDKDKPVRIELTEGVSLSGLVVDEQGKPVSGAKVIPLSKAGGTMTRLLATVVTEDGAVETVNGKFTLEHILPGSETLKITHGDYCFAIVKDIDVQPGTGAKDVKITITKGSTVKGHVFDDNGKPEAKVILYFQDDSGYSGSGDEEAGRFATAITDKDGYYEVHHLPEQLCYVKRAEEWEALGVVRRAILPKNGQVHTLDLGGKSRVVGQLILNGKPLAKTRIVLSGDSPHSGTFKSYTMTGENGTFTFLGTPPGKRTLYYDVKQGRRSDWLEVKTFEVTKANTDLGIINCPNGRISVTIQPDSEDILTGMRITLQEYDPKWIRSKSVGKLLPRPPNPTDPFVIENVPPGKYELVTHKKGLFSVRKVIEMKPGEKEKSVILRIPQGTASLSGTIAKEVCSPGGCQALKMWGKDKTCMAYIIPDEQGKYKVAHVPAGQYVITSHDVRDADVLSKVTFKEGEEKTLDLNKASCPIPDRSTGMLVVTIFTDEGIPLPGAEVYLIGDEERLERSSQHDCRQTFVGKVGSYELHATYPDYSKVKRKVALQSVGKGGVPSEQISVQIELTKQN